MLVGKSHKLNIFNQIINNIYRTHVRLRLSWLLDSLKYKLHNIKEMLPNFKEKTDGHWWKINISTAKSCEGTVLILKVKLFLLFKST